MVLALLLFSDEATKQLQKQESTQFESHSKIVEDLTQIQQKSHDALEKLGTVKPL